MATPILVAISLPNSKKKLLDAVVHDEWDYFSVADHAYAETIGIRFLDRHSKPIRELFMLEIFMKFTFLIFTYLG